MPQTALSPRNDRSERYEELLFAAAQCFQSRGFAATSIDTVARHLGATKGRVYHYFPSKMDLFNAVRDRAMDHVFDGTRTGFNSDAPTIDRLIAMARGHVRAILYQHPYMQVLMDGLQMNRYSTTTQFQREEMERHLARRDEYESQFRAVIAQGAAEGQLHVGPSQSITVQSFFSALNGPVFWFRPRDTDTAESLHAITEDVLRYSLLGLGVTTETQSYTTQEVPS
ncbi:MULTISPECIES: TetR/AcrR family transcriptional regulator [Roseobacteraceae]|uniref:TetR family transcriptional regulator n=1 Tax=Falsiruegeria litorea TaxID=1280831 RepID=A0ABS5WN99_9RHOB|nr:TetR/AcrR family transcriptional regulator [Phaeobacter gallaeciensis]MBT3140546.1 TetR family transcriptional regulator [Falsiruegeria litorea]MBT8169741.1 TetR family transcriptional regulator [Falsiruegeria litorea]